MVGVVMIKLLKTISTGLLLLISYCLNASSVLAYDVVISQRDMQHSIEPFMPITQQAGPVTLLVERADIRLVAGSDRIYVDLALAMSVYNQKTGDARAVISGQPYYDKKTNCFYLRDASLSDFHSPQLQPIFFRDIEELASLALATVFTDIPLYKLSDKTAEERSAKFFLQTVVIKNGQLVAEMALF